MYYSNMKTIILQSCFVLMTISISAQGKVYDIFSSVIIDKQNIQSEYYHRNTSASAFSDTRNSDLYLRYGLNNTVEIVGRISHLGISQNDIFGVSGFGLPGLGAKVHVYEGKQANLSLLSLVNLPIAADFLADTEFGFQFDMAYENYFTDFAMIGVNAGINNSGQDALSTASYLIFNGEIQVTEAIDVYGQFEQYFGELDDYNVFSLGSWIWVSEDIRLNVDYGWMNYEVQDGKRFTLGLLMRWLD